MADPTPTPLQVPDFRDRSRYPERAPHLEQSYAADFRALMAELSRREETPEIPPRPLADPALSQREYERKYQELRRKLSRY
jgi:hypothetical protein